MVQTRLADEPGRDVVGDAQGDTGCHGDEQAADVVGGKLIIGGGRADSRD